MPLVTHEHADHNGVEASPAGPHDRALDGGHVWSRRSARSRRSRPSTTSRPGTLRGPNTIFVFTLDGVRVAHFGDFGQSELREEQAAAVGEIDLLIIPVGAGPTIGAEQASRIVVELKPRWVVPMHYRTFADQLPRDLRMTSSSAWSTSSSCRSRCSRQHRCCNRRPADRRAGGALAGRAGRWPEGYNQVKPGKDLW